MSEAASDPAGWEAAPQKWLAIGRALLKAEQAMIPAELGRATRTDQSNAQREAEAMVKAGLLRPVAPPPRPGPAPAGRPPSKAYALVDEHEAALRLALERRGVGSLRRGQELVYAAANANHLEDLFTVLAGSNDAAQAVWSGLCSGDAQEYLLVFDGTDPVTPAVALVARLNAARIPCRRATITQIKPTQELIELAQETAREARRTRLSTDTRHAS